MPISERFKEYVHYSGKSITQLSKEIGVSQKGLNNIAQGTQPSTKMLLALASLGLNLHWLLTGEGEMLNSSNPTDLSDLDESTTQNVKLLFSTFEKLLAEKDNVIKAKDSVIKEKEKIIEEKERFINHFVAEKDLPNTSV